MKKINFVLIALLACLFTACHDKEEEIMIDKFLAFDKEDVTVSNASNSFILYAKSGHWRGIDNITFIQDGVKNVVVPDFVGDKDQDPSEKYHKGVLNNWSADWIVVQQTNNSKEMKVYVKTNRSHKERTAILSVDGVYSKRSVKITQLATPN